MTLALFQTQADPFTNKTNDFILILGTNGASFVQGQATATTAIITLKNSSGTVIANFDRSSFDIVAPTGVNVTTVTWSVLMSKRVIIVPPGWTLTAHVSAFGLSGTLEDLRGYV